MFVDCSYIVSFVVKSPSGGKNPWKTAPGNPRRSLFENCFKSWFDTVRWWVMSCAFDFLRNYWFRCFLRRVMAVLLQQENWTSTANHSSPFITIHHHSSSFIIIHHLASCIIIIWVCWFLKLKNNTGKLLLNGKAASASGEGSLV